MENNTITINGWIARDADDNDLWFYTTKPIRSIENKMFYSSETNSMSLVDEFPFNSITWENSPVKAKLTITIKNDG